MHSMPTRAQIETELHELNERIVHVVQRGGRAYISNATLRGTLTWHAPGMSGSIEWHTPA